MTKHDNLPRREERISVLSLQYAGDVSVLARPYRAGVDSFGEGGCFVAWKAMTILNDACGCGGM